MVQIEIDGKTIEAKPGSTVIQVADDNGIYIPRFCYHKKLPVAANCRMCLVEVEKVPKALPACATNIADGMKIFTQSPKAIQAQKAVMEFLLINHPLDCPICDQGGECALQDRAMATGSTVSVYKEVKRVAGRLDLGALIATDMTRCIQCTRCVRFGDVIAGDRELGMMERGGNEKVSTHVKKPLTSEVSGNIIDLCPVGALTSKPARFKSRAWEQQENASIAAHDCLGSHVYLNVVRDQLLRVIPRTNESINELWLSDRDRFSYVGTTSEERVLKPMVKKHGHWQTTDWATALKVAVNMIKKITDEDPNQLGALVSPNATVEESYLLQKFCRTLGSNNIDYRLRQTDIAEEAITPPGLGMRIADIENQQALFLIGSDIRREQPVAGLKVRKATLAGAKVFALNMVDFDFNFPVDAKIIVKPSLMVDELAGVAKALLELSGKQHDAAPLLQPIKPSDKAKTIAQTLLDVEAAALLLGAMALNHAQARFLRTLADLIGELSGATVGCLSEGANAQGAHLAGAIPHRGVAGKPLKAAGLTAKAMLEKGLKAYVLLNVEPELDCAHSAEALAALSKAFTVVAITPFATPALKKYATVILPMASLGGTSGTFVNAEGMWQSFAGAVAPQGEARPAWKILRVMGNLSGHRGFDYMSSEEVRQKIQDKLAVSSIGHMDPVVKPRDDKVTSPRDDKVTSSRDGVDSKNVIPRLDRGIQYSDEAWPTADHNALERITEVPMYATDALVRQSAPLSAMMYQDNVAAVRMHPDTAKQLGVIDGAHVHLQQNNTQKQAFTVVIDPRIAIGAVYVPAGLKETINLGAHFGAIEVLS